MIQIIQDICDFNNDVWNNKYGDYCDKLQASMQIEEALEGFTDLSTLARSVNSPYDNPKDVSRAIMSNVKTEEISDVDRFDKHLDSIYLDIGALHQLGLTPIQILEGLAIVHKANLQKTGPKDHVGKVIKPEGFVAPEEKLQLLLDNRS